MELSKKLAAIKGIQLPERIGHPGAFLVAQRGLEPRTADVSDRNSNHAELLRNVVIVVRGKERTRTVDPSLFRGVLHHLSYRAIALGACFTGKITLVVAADAVQPYVPQSVPPNRHP